jgi:hypothetical protein
MNMNNASFLKLLINSNVKFIVWGSEAGILHGYDITSQKDIDLIIESSDNNIHNFYLALSQFFPISYEDIINNDTILIRTKDKKPFDIKKQRMYSGPLFVDINQADSWCCNYENLINNSVIMTMLDSQVHIIGKEDYIKVIKLTLSNTEFPLTMRKKQRFEKLLKSNQ